MKKKLEAELISIAHRILQLKETSSLPQLQEEARQLYEKITILAFAESHFSGPQPTIGQIQAVFESEEVQTENHVESENEEEIKTEPEKESEVAVNNEIEFELEIEKENTDNVAVELENEELFTSDVKIPSKVEVDARTVPQIEEIVEEPIHIDTKPELVIEEVNARVTEDLFVPAASTTQEHTSFSEPEYEEEEKPKSLNDQLKKDIHIGLNDRLAFIKYLFDGSAPDYNRVLSQVETMANRREVMNFIDTMIKPDYNHWQGKEEYEERFMDAILGKFEH